jgi:hypothetical protein
MFEQSAAQLAEELLLVKAEIEYYKDLKSLLAFTQENIDEIDALINLSTVRQAALTKRLSAIIQ